MSKVKRVWSKNELHKIWEEKDKELDLLVDENSEFKINGAGRRILITKGTIMPMFFCRPKGGYISANIRKKIDGKAYVTSVARFLLQIKEKHLVADHINRNPLDNRFCNLRKVTLSQNAANSVGTKRYTYKGYSINGAKTRIESKHFGKKIKYTLNNITEETAAKVYDCISIELHGCFAKTNFNKDLYTKDYIESILSPFSAQRKIELSDVTIEIKLVLNPKTPDNDFLKCKDLLNETIFNELSKKECERESFKIDYNYKKENFKIY